MTRLHEKIAARIDELWATAVAATWAVGEAPWAKDQNFMNGH